MFLRTLFCGPLSDLVRQKLVCYVMPEFATNRSEALRRHAHAIYSIFFHGCENDKFSEDFVLLFSYFCSKHILWVHVRTASNEYPQYLF